jgi:ParB/RepB/Spo0J family partition protein
VATVEVVKRMQPLAVVAKDFGGKPDWSKPEIVQWISAEYIIPDPANTRRTWKKSELDELQESIRRDGILEPLVLRRQAGTDNGIIQSGHRRFRISRSEDMPKVPCRLDPQLYDDLKTLRGLLLRNEGRAPLPPIDEARALSNYMKVGKFSSQRELARDLGLPEIEVSKLLSLRTLPSDTQDLINSGKIPRSSAFKLVLLQRKSGCGDEKLNLVARSLAAGEFNGVDVEDYLRRERSKPTKPKASSLRSGAGGRRQVNRGMTLETFDLPDFVSVVVRCRHKAMSPTEVAAALRQASNQALASKKNS